VVEKREDQLQTQKDNISQIISQNQASNTKHFMETISKIQNLNDYVKDINEKNMKARAG